jgi:ABC-type branched-subunit amino acid transport system substrate-binding protein
MSKSLTRVLAVLAALALVMGACGDDDTDESGGEGPSGETGGGDGDGDAAEIDYEAIGLWDDGPCDESLDPLMVGLITTFESAVVSLGDQALALEAAAEAFNARGGANGACIEVVTCDDGANLDQAVGCAREMEESGVHATINDQSTAGQAEVSAAMAESGIPRVAGNVTNLDWDDTNAYPMDASGTGSTFMMPKALIDAGVTEIGAIRVSSPGAGALLGLLEGVYEGEATFEADVPVAEGTTDFSQFILAVEDEGAEGAILAIGEQEAVQVVRAAQQLGSDLALGVTLGTFSHSAVSELGDYAENMAFTWSFPPATSDLPVYEALRADFEASGEEALAVENLKASPMRSWIGLYGLLYLIRDAGMTEFSGEAIATMLQEAEPVPMLGIFGDQDWDPNVTHEGLFQRYGTTHWATYEWDPDADAVGDLEGNWVEIGTANFDEVLCGSPIGGPC